MIVDRRTFLLAQPIAMTTRDRVIRIKVGDRVHNYHGGNGKDAYGVIKAVANRHATVKYDDGREKNEPFIKLMIVSTTDFPIAAAVIDAQTPPPTASGSAPSAKNPASPSANTNNGDGRKKKRKSSDNNRGKEKTPQQESTPTKQPSKKKSKKSPKKKQIEGED